MNLLDLFSLSMSEHRHKNGVKDEREFQFIVVTVSLCTYKVNPRIKFRRKGLDENEMYNI